MTGTLANWAYHERGCVAFAVELWDLFAAAGPSEASAILSKLTLCRTLIRSTAS